ncbi:MAG: hypothetical protein K8H99_05875 [Nitrospirae bacterium]|nr:hypothetical protein [Fimbriimonadaceae bacterium]
MMTTKTTLLAATALLVAGAQAQDRVELASDGKDRSIGLTFGGLGASFGGRSLSSKYLKFDIQPVKQFKLWFGSQSLDAKGKEDPATGNRSTFDARATEFGMRYEFQSRGGAPFGVSYIAHRSGDGTFEQTDGSSALYFGPKTDTFEVDHEGWSGSYSRIKAGSRSASVFGVGYAGKQPLKAKGWSFLYEGKLLFERPSGTVVNPDGSTRAMARLGLEYGSPEWGSISLSAYVFPGGIPYTGTPLSGFTSFFLYEPGGVADDLRTKTSATLDLRVSLKASF